MAEEEFVEKTPLEKSRDIINQLKEMQHYSKTNIEKLTAFWLQIDDELKQKDIAKKIEGLLTHENKVHDTLESVIEAHEAECARLEPKT
jgi:tRNA(His) 5'-end guanylyltransferase